MDAMKSHIKNILSTFSVVMLAALLMVVAANAQPAPAPKESPEPKKAADTKSTDAKSGQAKSINTKATASKPTKKPAETVPTSNTVGEDAGSYTVTSTKKLAPAACASSATLTNSGATSTTTLGPAFLTAAF